MKRALGKKGLLQAVSMSESKINALEKAGEFPQRFCITESRVAWNADEVEAWIDSTRPRVLSRKELLQVVPLSWFTISKLEKEGAFPKRLNAEKYRIEWDAKEVESWLDARQKAGTDKKPVNVPDVHQRKSRPVREVA